jgi:AcrR family transcriptional regulator/DNA-binding MarR family transcriptional regulator
MPRKRVGSGGSSSRKPDSASSGSAAGRPVSEDGSAAGRPVSGDGPARARTGPGGGLFARDQVEDIQRARVLSALCVVAAERGAGATTVAHIVARAGVSRRTFYELFSDRDDCFVAAFDQAVERVAARVVPAFEGPGRWHEQVRAALVATLGFFDEEPELGALCVVHALGAGPQALEHRAAIIGVLVDAVDEGGRASRGRAPERLTAEGVVGSVLAILHKRLSEGSRESLSDLAGPLMAMIVLPYLGSAAAERERVRPAPKRVASKRPAVRENPLKGLDMRLTYRTVRMLLAISQTPGASNRQVGDAAGISDQGQTSKLLRRLERLELIQNTGAPVRGEPNAWRLTDRGKQLERTVKTQVPSADS